MTEAQKYSQEISFKEVITTGQIFILLIVGVILFAFGYFGVGYDTTIMCMNKLTGKFYVYNWTWLGVAYILAWAAISVPAKLYQYRGRKADLEETKHKYTIKKEPLEHEMKTIVSMLESKLKQASKAHD